MEKNNYICRFRISNQKFLQFQELCLKEDKKPPAVLRGFIKDYVAGKVMYKDELGDMKEILKEILRFLKKRGYKRIK